MHGELLAWDFLTCLGQWAEESVTVYFDHESLKSIRNPVNLNMHHHEELSARSPEQIQDYQEIMKIDDYDERVDKLRPWYRGCQKALLPEANKHRNKVVDLDFTWLCGKIKNAKKTKFLGGSSMNILQRLLQEKSVAQRIDCYWQAVRDLPPLHMKLGPNTWSRALTI